MKKKGSDESENKSLQEMSAAELKCLLSERQYRFVEALVEGEDATSAAITAGYAKSSAASQASKLLKIDKVAAYRRARYIDLYAKIGLSPEWVGVKLYEIVERCMAATPHMVWDKSSKSYVPDGNWMFDAHGAVKALAAISKNFSSTPDKDKGGDAKGIMEAFFEQMGGGREF